MNIHLLTTKKPTKLHNKNGSLYGEYTKLYIKEFQGNEYNSFHMHITSNEEIKEGDWFIGDNINLRKCTLNNAGNINFKGGWYSGSTNCKKIILTTDPDLIKDGIQAIDDKFLEWFVKNPTCNEVEINLNSFGECHIKGDNCSCYDTADQSLCKLYYPNYKIIIPKEELKQETLEEAAERLQKDKYGIFISKDIDVKGQLVIDTANAAFLSGMVEGSTWQQKRSYTEEEVLLLLQKLAHDAYINQWNSFEKVITWFEQFKKK